MTTVCRSDGTWDPPLQNCSVKCPKLTVPHATVVIDTSDPYKANVTCYHGHRLPDGNVSAVAICTNRSWTALDCHLPVCDDITLQNATVELTYVDEVAIATIRCNGSNLFLDHSTERVHVCVGGAWTPSLQDCAGICDVTRLTSLYKVNVTNLTSSERSFSIQRRL
ncbi:uncharacterized protein LOC112561367 [Pomacea canaliculata]|uniref:uncharacterized protein LOC112561367 n=1 Tax=Pomacea canaliculata TaxID=400727 RepID=UPI000D72D4B9|nr:uncharacterized protein LOC112561367 [Pomacea canaliculata]